MHESRRPIRISSKVSDCGASVADVDKGVVYSPVVAVVSISILWVLNT